MQLDLTFEQILSLVKQLPKKEKVRLSKELEKDAIDSKLSKLLDSFETKDLNLDTLSEEVENVRQGIYEKRKRESDF
ncbi:type II toxin-antitoxin system VapB15 family antitoxin [Algoriphagus oliviformis]|uniref:type II toxin-antitoxin system VapB15 family antitoxin n=1 Tax=Algoriphagus oliviformis TaxID=2811231 RepID=UPI001F380EA3|nr:hypothetical protein [Algoriphagus oliviformis]